MEKELRDPLLASKGLNVLELVAKYGRESLLDELSEMLFDEPFIVFTAAQKINDEKLSKEAAIKVAAFKKCSIQEKEKAWEFLRRPSEE